jgi:hypothetical protein
MTRFALALAALSAAGAASAFEFNEGPVGGSLDSTVSAGALWRTESRDPSNIGFTNGGTAHTVNGDDGDLNFAPGDLVSSPLKLSSELELRYLNYGLFTRGYAFVDPKVVLDHDKYGPAAYSRLHATARFLDAFASGRFHVADRNLNARIGWQVVSWGESTFIPNGINVVNPVDLARLRSPGAEIKEALLPSPMLWVSQELTKTLSVEGFALTQFNPVRLDPRNSFFSTTDVLNDDGNRVVIGAGRAQDDHYPATNPIPASVPVLGPAAALLFGPFNPAAKVWVPRDEDRRPSDSLGQFGVAFRYLASWANDTEFALYFLNYASRTPFVSARKTDMAGPNVSATSPDQPGGLTSVVTFSGVPLIIAATGMDGSTRYFADYPDNIHMIGVSFNTQGPWDSALQGEYSYRPNQPLQVASNEVFSAALNLPAQFAPDAASIPFGAEVTGWRRTRFHQVQISDTKNLPHVLGADLVTLVGEVGYVFQELPYGIRYDGPGVSMPSLPEYADIVHHPESLGSIQSDGFATHSSWGYRLLARADYSDVFAAVNLTPRVAFSHDVHGVSQTFNQQTKSASVGLTASYLSRWTADVAYTSYFGGRKYCGKDNETLLAAKGLATSQSPYYCTSANPMRDRDFAALTLSYSF